MRIRIWGKGADPDPQHCFRVQNYLSFRRYRSRYIFISKITSIFLLAGTFPLPTPWSTNPNRPQLQNSRQANLLSQLQRNPPSWSRWSQPIRRGAAGWTKFPRQPMRTLGDLARWKSTWWARRTAEQRAPTGRRSYTKINFPWYLGTGTVPYV